MYTINRIEKLGKPVKVYWGKRRQRCRIHYAEKNRAPDNIWREKEGHILCYGKGPGPKNVLVATDAGNVVVPRGNIQT